MTQRKKTQAWMAALLLLGILIIDQLIKIAVKTNYAIGGFTEITSWCQIRFTENNGMAFGMEILPKWTLTVFRLVAVGALLWYIRKVIRRGISWGLLICMVLVTAGAAGNIFDCLFYGLIFSSSGLYDVAHFVPWGEGYGTFLNGYVVDMFYFPIVEWDWPSWVPFCGGDHFIFFSPIFNFADACITCGFLAILLFYRKKILR